MNNLYKFLIVGLLSVLLIGFSFGSVSSSSNQGNAGGEYTYRDVLNSADGVIRLLRLGEEISESKMDSLENKCLVVFSNQDDEVEDYFSQLPNHSDLKVEDARDLRNKIEEWGNTAGFELSSVYKYSIFIVLCVSFTLAIVVNLISRTVVDWKKVNEVKEKQSDMQDELKRAREENDRKKMYKLQNRLQEFRQEHMGVMLSPMKTMLIIIIPFMLVFSILNSTYGNWVVAWLPFTLPWPDINLPLISRFLSGSTPSFGFFGWYILSYFGFSQIWRNILVPD